MMKEQIEQEIKWHEENRGKSGKGEDFEDGFIMGLKQTLLYADDEKEPREDVLPLVSMVNHLANIIIDIAGQTEVYGNQLNTANDYLDLIIPLLDAPLPKETK